MLAVMEANGSGAASVVGGPRHDSRARTLRQRAPRANDPCRFRVHPRKACSHREQALPVLDDQTRISPRVEAQLCLNSVRSDQGSEEGLAMARSCQHADDRDLHASRSIDKARSTRIGHGTYAQIGAIPGKRQVDCILDRPILYAERKKLTIAQSGAPKDETPHNNIHRISCRS